MMSSGEGTKTLIEQLRDPTQSHRAVLALAMKGPDAVPALAEFLRPSKPSSLSEPRLMAVECLSILKGPEALEALITVCKERLNEIADSIVRLRRKLSSAGLLQLWLITQGIVRPAKHFWNSSREDPSLEWLSL